jgi:ribokinase
MRLASLPIVGAYCNLIKVKEKKRVASIGSIIFDLAVTTPRVPITGENILARAFKMGPGGKGANAAAAIAKLGAESILVGSVGDDTFGQTELQALKDLDVRIDGVKIDPNEPTGIAVIMVDDEGENTILVVIGANAALTPDDARAALRSWWDQLDAIQINFEIPQSVVAAVIEEARQRGVPAVLDAGPPRSFDRDTWAKANIISPNRLETESLVGRSIETEEDLIRAAREILESGPDAVVLKRGSEGSLVCTSQGIVAVPAFEVETIDTTGAGDAFTAALTVGIAEGKSLEEAVLFGSAAGALAVTRLGTMPAMPTRSEVDQFLLSRSGA